MSLHVGAGRGFGHINRSSGVANAPPVGGPQTYDFAGNNYPAVSMSRASSNDGARDLADVWSTFNADTLRRTNRGAIFEPASTNFIRNSTAQGSVAGTPGTSPNNWVVTSSTAGLTRQIVGMGTESGLPYIDVRYSGTTTAAVNLTISPEASNQVVATQGQDFVHSLFAKLVSGTIPSAVIRMNERDSANASLVVADTAITLAGTLQRFSVPRVMTNAGCAFIYFPMVIALANATAYDFTIRIAAPQMERGSVPSTVIRTTNAAAARAADAGSFVIPAGVSSQRFTFDDATTQDVAVSTGTYNIPTTFAPKYVSKIEQFA